MIQRLNFDIVGICESWLMDKQVLSILEYKWFGHNRADLSSRAVRGSGGVGVLIKESLLLLYSVETIDTSFDGIIWLVLSPNYGGEELAICVCYIPPESSSRGDCSQEFFDWLASQIVEYSCGRQVIVCGDFNARCGNLTDCPIGDTVKNRIVIDTVANSFGISLIGFLKDVGMCIVNGRGKPELDNFTSVSSRGKAVVDYCITSYTGLEHVTDFRVHLVTQLCEMLDFKGDYRLPDHSLVSWLWEVHGDMGTTDAISRTYGQQEVHLPCIRAVPEGFLEDMNDSFTN